MTYYIAADVGGSQIRVALYSSTSSTPVRLHKIATQGDDQTPIQRLISAIHQCWPDPEEVAAIGLATAGSLDPTAGIVFEAPNIPGWVDLPLRTLLSDHFAVPVAIGNDANLAALAEWKFGAGKGHHTLIYLTVSTGIGAGVIINDQLLVGVRGLAGELGHITVDPHGPMCRCGMAGHLEALASGPAIARWVEEQIQAGATSLLPANTPLTAKVVSLAAQNGDSLACAAFVRAGDVLGRAIADWLHCFNPSAVIIGGGVSHAGELLLNPLRNAMVKAVLNDRYLEGLVLTTAALGDNAGLLGALTLAQSITEGK